MLIDKIYKRTEEIRTDRVHGANYLTKFALRICGTCANIPAKTKKDFYTQLVNVIRGIKSARPDMVSISNLTKRFKDGVAKRYKKYSTKRLKSFTASLSIQLIRELKEAQRGCVKNAAKFLCDGDTVLTTSFSTSVLETLVQAHNRGKRLNIFVVESRCEDLSYGEMFAKRLAKNGLGAKVISGQELTGLLPKISKVIIGADAVFKDGAIINGTPSFFLGTCAKKKGIPLFVVCESFKQLPYLRDRKFVLENGFDYIPASFVSAIITEKRIWSKNRIRGIYQLLLFLSAGRFIKIGNRNRTLFPAGYYVYVGSAMGGIMPRVGRHLRKEKKLRWHIDYFLKYANVVGVRSIQTNYKKLECKLSKRLGKSGGVVIFKKFGSSDCNCPSHLYYFGNDRNAFTKTGCSL
jgi:sugar fermentation stimulation protein A